LPAEQKADFPLLSDPTKETAKAYGVLNTMGIASRVTFVIGADGKVLAIDRNVNPATAAQDIASTLGTARHSENEVLTRSRRLRRRELRASAIATGGAATLNLLETHRWPGSHYLQSRLSHCAVWRLRRTPTPHATAEQCAALAKQYDTASKDKVNPDKLKKSQTQRAHGADLCAQRQSRVRREGAEMRR
jgi:hypothetical protein